MGRLQTAAIKSSRFTSTLQNPKEKCILFVKHIPCARQFYQVLGYFLANGLQNCSFLATKLVDSCNSMRRMDIASSIFRQIRHPSPFLWTAMIRGFSESGSHRLSIHFFGEMRRQGVGLTYLTFPFVLKACSSIAGFWEGRQIHTQTVKTGFLSDAYVRNGVLDLYVKCGSMENARILYEEMPEWDIVSHTSIVSGYFAVGDLVSARMIFDVVEGGDVVLWSAMITGYAQNGKAAEALALFDQMQSLGVRGNSVTMASVLSACAQLGDVSKGRCVHDFMVRSNMAMNVVVRTSLLDMYIKGGFMDEAREIFSQMPQKDVVSWNSLIYGYAINGHANEALELFKEMLDHRVQPNKVTFLSALSSCAQLGAILKGREVDNLIREMGVESDLSVDTALIDMYAKCGNLKDACCVFNRIQARDVVAWSALINGFAVNGHYSEVTSLFGQMFKEGVWPNGVTYLGILTACSHGGMVDEGRKHFDFMIKSCHTQPKMEHYACMVDLLGRAGLVEEAKCFIGEMPIEPGASVWGSLLGACATHKNIPIGEYAAKHLIELEPENDLCYVFLSNIYAHANKWKDVETTRLSMRCSGAHKMPGCSWIEVEDKIHEFQARNRTHPFSQQIDEMLDSFSKQLRLVEDFT